MTSDKIAAGLILAGLIALGAVAVHGQATKTDDVSISTKAPHICDDCQSRYHTR